MPTPPRMLTNDPRDCRLVVLDKKDPASPLVVMQEGYSSNDPKCQMKMFYLQRNGLWIDEIARSTRPENEIKDIVFDTAADAIKAISGLFGKPIIRELPVTSGDVENYMSRARSGPPAELFREFLRRYRATQQRN